MLSFGLGWSEHHQKQGRFLSFSRAAFLPEDSHMKRPSRVARCSGFTLVEMLVVITIIGILAGMVTAAAVVARRRARIAAMKMELSQLDMALKAYKEKFGEYPPDFSDQGAVIRHLAKAFPRCSIPGATVAAQFTNLQSTINTNWGVDINSYGPQAALAFWLGGLPTAPAGVVTGFSGFAADPTNPFQTVALCPSRVSPFFDFDLTRVKMNTNTVQYYPDFPGGPGIETAYNPYVYFRAENGNYTTDGQPTAAAGTTIKRFYPDPVGAAECRRRPCRRLAHS